MTAVAGHPVKSLKGLQLLMEELRVGEEVNVSLLRGDTPYEARVTLAEDPE